MCDTSRIIVAVVIARDESHSPYDVFQKIDETRYSTRYTSCHFEFLSADAHVLIVVFIVDHVGGGGRSITRFRFLGTWRRL